MIEGLVGYSNYRQAGLPWLPLLPAHWRLVRAKTVLKAVDVRSVTGAEELLTVSSSRGVIPRRSATVTMFKAESYVGHKLCWPDDLVINSLWAWGRGLGVARDHGIISTAYGVYRRREPDALLPEYLDALVRSTPFQWELQVRSKGVWISRLQMTDASFLDAPLPLPPPEEQAAIVRFLDHADQRIRKAIRIKQRLVKLLEEEKRAIIHRAVTRGIGDGVELRDSKVDWLGAVPAHWAVERLKSLARIKTGGRDTVHKREDGEFPFFVRSQTVERIDTWSFDGEAVLTAGDGAGVAKVFHHIEGKFDYHQRVYRFSDFKRIAGRYFFFYFRETLRFEAFRETAKSTVDSLRLPMLQNFPVPVPPIQEQDAIVEFLESTTDRVTNAVEVLRSQVRALQELRTRLIADVVTGQLDVRAAAAALPDEPEDLDLTDDSDPDEGEDLDSDDDVPAEDDDA